MTLGRLSILKVQPSPLPPFVRGKRYRAGVMLGTQKYSPSTSVEGGKRYRVGVMLGNRMYSLATAPKPPFWAVFLFRLSLLILPVQIRVASPARDVGAVSLLD